MRFEILSCFLLTSGAWSAPLAAAAAPKAIYLVNGVEALTGYTPGNVTYNFVLQTRLPNATDPYKCSATVKELSNPSDNQGIGSEYLDCEGEPNDPNPQARIANYFQGAIVRDTVSGDYLKFGQKGYDYGRSTINLSDFKEWASVETARNGVTLTTYTFQGVPEIVESGLDPKSSDFPSA